MASAKRTNNKHLPKNVYFKHSAYYLVTLKDKKRKWKKLGNTLHESMKMWSELIGHYERISTMSQLFDRYLLEIAPQKAPKTYKDNIKGISNLRVFFGNMSPDAVKPPDIYRYLDIRGQIAKRAANLERGMLSHVFTCAIRWGIVDDNPCRNVKRIPEKKRDRYITDKEFINVLNFAPPLIKCAMKLAYLTALRKGDILSLKLSDITEEGIKKTTNKTGKKLLIGWSKELSNSIKEIKELSRPIRGLHLFCTKRGQPYTADGFTCMWQRLIKKALNEGIIDERFRFHDIRRKSATDLQRSHGIEKARQLLGHESQSMTSHYISGEQKVNPVK